MLDSQPEMVAPAVAIDTLAIDRPLPEGVRGFRLSPANRRDYRIRTPVILAFAAFLLALRLLNLAFVGASLPFFFAVEVLWMLASWRLQRRMTIVHEAVYRRCDLLIGEHAARLNTVGAEILRSEIDHVYETPGGLWIMGALRKGKKSFFLISKSFEHYDEARAIVDAWKSIEPAGRSRASRLIEYVYARGVGAKKHPAEPSDDASRIALEALRSYSPDNERGPRAELQAYRWWSAALLYGFLLFLLFVTVFRFR
jgi:hypothetical protein